VKLAAVLDRILMAEHGTPTAAELQALHDMQATLEADDPVAAAGLKAEFEARVFPTPPAPGAMYRIAEAPPPSERPGPAYPIDSPPSFSEGMHALTVDLGELSELIERLTARLANQAEDISALIKTRTLTIRERAALAAGMERWRAEGSCDGGDAFNLACAALEATYRAQAGKPGQGES